MTLDVKQITNWHGPVTLREFDEQECRLAFGSGEEALRFSLEQSTCAYVVTVNKEPLAWFGFRAAAISDWADVWMLTAPVADEWPLMVARGSQRVITGMLDIAPNLAAIVDTRHTPARKWLRWLGFQEQVHSKGLLKMTLSKKDWRWAS